MDRISMTIHPPTSQESLADRVRERGWVHFRGPRLAGSLADDILDVAQTLGEPIGGRKSRVVEALVPTDAEHAKSNSLSARYGRGAFPFHVDGAHRSSPPRFLVLACVEPGASPVPTLLLRFHELGLDKIELQQCTIAPFVVRNGRRSFYATITNKERSFVRFDRGCMKPNNSVASNLAEKITRLSMEVQPTEIYWTAGDILVIDNSRVLHARATVSSIDSLQRKILRVAVR